MKSYTGYLFYIEPLKDETLDEQFQRALGFHNQKHEEPDYCVVWEDCGHVNSVGIKIEYNQFIRPNHFLFGKEDG